MMTALDIMHPEDKKALLMLQKIPFIDGVCRSLLKVGYERLFRGENLAMMIKTSSQCLPRVYNLMKQTTEKIGLAMPEVYVYNDPVMNAFTFGETNVYVCISSSCVEKLDDEELMCLMAHECGHILCKHVLYKSVVRIIQDFGNDFGVIPYTLTGPIYLTLQYWSRRSEFSADRCAAATMGEKVFQHRHTLRFIICRQRNLPFHLRSKGKGARHRGRQVLRICNRQECRQPYRQFSGQLHRVRAHRSTGCDSRGRLEP